MDPRSELERLRKLKRLQELEAKASGQSEPAPQETSQGQDQGAGAAFTNEATDMVLAGHAPQVAGAARFGTEGLIRGLGKLGIGPYAGMEELRDSVAPEEVGLKPNTYVDNRDEYIADAKATSEANPNAALAGKVAGTGLSIAGGGMAAKGLAKAAPKAAQAVKGMGTFRKGAIAGGTTSAAWNPGDVEGEVQGLQLDERLANAPAGAVVGGVTNKVLAGAGDAISNQAEISRMLGRLRGGTAGRFLKDKTDEAVQALNDKVISPPADKLRRLLGKADDASVQINPERIKNISPGLDKYAQRLEAKVPEGELRASLSPKKAQRLKRVVGGRAEFHKRRGQTIDPVSVTKHEQAQKGYDILKRGLEDVDPQIGQLNDEMQKGLNLRDVLQDKTKEPLTAYKATDIGKPLYEVFSEVDNLAGTNLNKVSDQVTSAANILPNYEKLAHPLEALKETIRFGRRGFAHGARAVDAVTPQGSREVSLSAILRAIAEGNREE